MPRDTSAAMDYDLLVTLRRTHPAWRLLCAEHAPLVLSFLYAAFVRQNVRTMAQPELVARLEDTLYALREREGPEVWPRGARQYLDEWSDDAHGWLRRYYPADSDVLQYDLTPATEKAVDWLLSLERRQFVATESRLMTVFELLRQITEGTEADPERRIAELERRRAEIDAEIQRIQSGDLNLMDDARVRDRFQQMASTARGLLSDFREVEQNFRDLDRAVRERVASWDGRKGALLADIFGQRDAIADSDQGQSFRAFWDFLMAPDRQDELSALLERVFALDAVAALRPDPRLRRVHFDWLEAGEVTQRTVARLSEQLRRFLDDRAWLENRRVMELIREVEQHALALRDAPPEGAVSALDEPAPTIELPMERPLYSPPLRPQIRDAVLVEGEPDADADALFAQVSIDRGALEQVLRQALRARGQVSLGELIAARPLEHGLAELLVWLTIASEHPGAVFDEAHPASLAWADPSGTARRATLPTVIFSRPGVST